MNLGLKLKTFEVTTTGGDTSHHGSWYPKTTLQNSRLLILCITIINVIIVFMFSIQKKYELDSKKRLIILTKPKNLNQTK